MDVRARLHRRAGALPRPSSGPLCRRRAFVIIDLEGDPDRSPSERGLTNDARERLTERQARTFEDAKTDLMDRRRLEVH